MNNNRIEYIDIARGIGITLVVFGHVVWGKNYTIYGHQLICNLIYSFHMPLFFVISGMCIKESKELNKKTIIKMLKAYIVPYLFWTIIYMVGFLLLGFHGEETLDNSIAHALSVCGLAPLWFLLALFISEVLVIIIKPLLNNWRNVCVFLCFLVLGTYILSIAFSYINDVNLLLKNYIIGLFRIFPTTFFVSMGYIFKDIINRIVNIQIYKRVLLVFVLCFIQVMLCLVWNETIDVQVFALTNPFLYFLKSLNGTLAILLISQMLHTKLFVYLGKNTKELMILHYPPFYYTIVLRFLLKYLFVPNIFGAIIITIITMTCCILINSFMKKFKFWNILMGGKNYYENR